MGRAASAMIGAILLVALGTTPARSASATTTWTSPDGTIRFDYPADWYLVDYPADWYLVDDRWEEEHGQVTVQNVAPVGHSAENGEFIVRFLREAKTARTTLGRLKARDCSDFGPSELRSKDRALWCGAVTINGWRWSWVRQVSPAFEDSQSRNIATIVDGWVYRGVAIIPGGSLQARGLAETKTILESVMVGRPRLPATGLDPSVLWVGALMLLGGLALEHISRGSRHTRSR